MLYFDEAGYTEPDLTNNIQPYFALASIRMTADEIDCMKKDILAIVNGERNSISKVCIPILMVGRCWIKYLAIL